MFTIFVRIYLARLLSIVIVQEVYSFMYIMYICIYSMLPKCEKSLSNHFLISRASKHPISRLNSSQVAQHKQFASSITTPR